MTIATKVAAASARTSHPVQGGFSASVVEGEGSTVGGGGAVVPAVTSGSESGLGGDVTGSSLNNLRLLARSVTVEVVS